MMKTTNKINSRHLDKSKTKEFLPSNGRSIQPPISMYATQGSLIKEFITKKENFMDETTERRSALVNRHGFIAALIDGFNSDGNRRMEVVLPETADLSLTQNGGFSVFLWFLIKKQPGGVHRFIIKRGNTIDELTPSIGVLPNGVNLFVKINSSKHKVETLFSNRKLEPNRMYSLAVTFAIDYSSELTDIALFLDGVIDSQLTVPGEPLHNQGNLYVGKCDNLNHGFAGCAADILLVPRVLEENEIYDINSECLSNLNSYKQFKTFDVFFNKFERENLIQKYSHYTGNPDMVIQNLGLNNDELREIVKKFDHTIEENSHYNDGLDLKESSSMSNYNKIIHNFGNLLNHETNENNSPLKVSKTELIHICQKMAANARFIYTVLFLVNSNEDEIDIKRSLGVFEILSEILHIELNEKLLHKMSEILHSYNDETKTIKMQTFFLNLRSCISAIFPDVKLDYAGSDMKNNNPLEMNSVELHENLLLNSQNFKNYIDDDLERSLAKSSFTIRSLYSRMKSGRPMTGNNFASSRGEDGDYVNQHIDNLDNFDNLDNKNEYAEAEAENLVLVEHPDEYKEELIMQEDHGETIKKEENIVMIDKNTQDGEFSKPIENEIQLIKNDDQNSEQQKVENIPQSENNIPLNNIQSPSVIIEEGNLPSPNKGLNSMLQTNFDDVISNFENKVMLKSSDRNTANTANQFMDPDNMIPVNGMTTSHGFNESPKLDHQEEGENKNGEEILEPKFPNDWNEGSFELVISHCSDCHLHKTTTRHLEYTFVDKFNEIGEHLKTIFPNIRIVGNVDRPEYFGCFDIYLRGAGPRLDENGRFHIFKRNLMKRFPTTREVGDKLIALSMLYGSSGNMELAQSQYMKSYEELFSVPFKGAHEHPHTLSEEGEKAKEDYENLKKKPPLDDPERTKLFCLNSGCGTIFVQVENGPSKCTYHPGVWQFGSHHGYWPEAWSCCERSWDSEGCTKGLHTPVRNDRRVLLCLNHGEINPHTNHPDSACGAYYTAAEKTVCKYHSGRISAGKWTCCGGEKNNLEGCAETKHSSADWPDEKAKLTFYPKPLLNPGVKMDSENKRFIVGAQIAKCDFFKEVKPYENAYSKIEMMKNKRDKEKDEPRYCVRWACEKTYKDAENTPKSCQCHPGKWDHGSTGTRMTEFVREMNVDPKSLDRQTILWKPHWTCCRKGWDHPGCKLTKHSGPLLEEFQKSSRKFKWPDQRLKLYFPKVVSDKWKVFLQKYQYPENVVKQICRKYFSDSRRTMSDLPQLCDHLRLYLLVVSDDVQYQMKFMDIATQNEIATKFLVVSNYVDCDRFVRWWFMDYQKIYESITIGNDKK